MFAKTCGQDQVCTELSQRKSNVSECKLLTFQPEAECWFDKVSLKEAGVFIRFVINFFLLESILHLRTATLPL